MCILVLCMLICLDFHPQIYSQQSLDMLSAEEEVGTMQLLRSLTTVLLVSSAICV